MKLWVPRKAFSSQLITETCISQCLLNNYLFKAETMMNIKPFSPDGVVKVQIMEIKSICWNFYLDFHPIWGWTQQDFFKF